MANGLSITVDRAILAQVPHAQNGDGCIGNFIPHLVMTNDNPAHLMRSITVQLFPNPGVVAQPIRRAGQCLDDSCRSSGRYLRQKGVQPDKIAGRAPRPFNLHVTGGDSGASVDRLSAQAVTA